MQTETRSRACREGWLGRRRNYKCCKCGNKFRHDGLQLPKDLRICPECRISLDKSSYRE